MNRTSLCAIMVEEWVSVSLLASICFPAVVLPLPPFVHCASSEFLIIRFTGTLPLCFVCRRLAYRLSFHGCCMRWMLAQFSQVEAVVKRQEWGEKNKGISTLLFLLGQPSHFQLSLQL